MALKITVHETCPRCGQKNARQDEDGTVWLGYHNCPDAPPGPPSPPRSFRPGQVIFVPAEPPAACSPKPEAPSAAEPAGAGNPPAVVGDLIAVAKRLWDTPKGGLSRFDAVRMAQGLDRAIMVVAGLAPAAEPPEACSPQPEAASAADNSAGVGSDLPVARSTQPDRPQPQAVSAPIGGIINPPDVLLTDEQLHVLEFNGYHVHKSVNISPLAAAEIHWRRAECFDNPPAAEPPEACSPKPEAPSAAEPVVEYRVHGESVKPHCTPPDVWKTAIATVLTRHHYNANGVRRLLDEIVAAAEPPEACSPKPEVEMT